MIVRISMEDQYRLPDGEAAQLNQLDNQVVEAIGAGEEQRFRQRFDEMLELVRRAGERLGDEALVESDVILPPADLSFEEAGREFTGDGLIPD